jgi:uncharacterized protein
VTATAPGARRSPPRGVIGVIHLSPLPGAHRWGGDMGVVLDRARADAQALAAGGVDALLIENYGDSPFLAGPVPHETVAALTAATLAVAAGTELPLGVNALRNDAGAALAVAAATGCRFIRVNVHTGGMYTDQGWIQGDAARTLRIRERLAPAVAILADVLVKHAVAPPGLDLERAARDAWERGHADALIISGARTGEPTALDDVRRVRAAVPEAPVLVGSGVDHETVRATLALADGAIIGSAFRVGGVAGQPVDPERVRRVLEAAGRR